MYFIHLKEIKFKTDFIVIKFDIYDYVRDRFGGMTDPKLFDQNRYETNFRVKMSFWTFLRRLWRQ